MKETDKKYYGKMVNISANGFAFSVKDELFANAKRKDVAISINNFDVIYSHFATYFYESNEERRYFNVTLNI